MHEVHQDEPNRLQIIPPTLLKTKMRIYRGVPHRPHKGLVLLVRDVLVRLDVLESSTQPKINQVDYVGLILKANEEVLGL